MTRNISISIASLFTGFLVIGLGAYLLAPRIYGACALDAVPFQTTYEEACK
nr:hypothetical protein [uncultured Mediterranean phage uvMED]BAR30428.1 hypothetical protein [uncultured Mediterranean phage uvMED]